MIYGLANGTLRLHDVVAPTMPSLTELARALGPGFDRVEIAFAPDDLDARSLVAQPVDADDDVLMVRGPDLPQAGGFALSPLAHT